LRKRPVEPERIDRAVSKIVRELENQGESEVSSETIGEMVMETLRTLDDVAYVRFASVYRNFREARDFEAVLDELAGEEDKTVVPTRKETPHANWALPRHIRARHQGASRPGAPVHAPVGSPRGGNWPASWKNRHVHGRGTPGDAGGNMQAACARER